MAKAARVPQAPRRWNELLERGDAGAEAIEWLELGVLGAALLVAAPAWVIYSAFAAGLHGAGAVLSVLFAAGLVAGVRDFRRGHMGLWTGALFCAFALVTVYAGLQLLE